MEVYPLIRANRIRLARAFQSVPSLDLSIECVLEGQMGKAFVDDLDRPRAFQIQTGPFVYFAGDPTCLGTQLMLKNLAPYTFSCPLRLAGWRWREPSTGGG